MASIQLLVGSVGGTALDTAATIAALLRKLGHDVELNAEPRPIDLSRNPDEVLLVCCSTTGDGEVPRNLFRVYLALEDGQIDLAGRCYGVLGLGSRAYPRFAHASFLLEGLLHRSGARRLGEMGTLDARVVKDHRRAGAQWAIEWSKHIG